MSSRDEQEINFLDAMFGLLFEPGGTVRTLLSSARPPFSFTIFLCLILSIVVPIVAQTYKYGYTIFNIEAVASLALILFFTVLIFILVEGIFLQLLGIHVTIRQLWCTVAYCITPFILALWLIYLFNYLAMGRLTLVTLFMTGHSAVDDRFLRIIPFAMLIAQLNMLVVFFHSVRFIGELHTLTATIITLFSLVPFYVALLIALSIAELARTGTIALFQKILLSPASLTYFSGG